ncbi:MAG: hypothetical protein LBK40_03310, partial [Spirochaetaceae bacterium]|nr:hypothetical protein [Spirochaetaceae bacterium]
EKLCPVLGFYTEDGWENACKRCVSILANEGAGHTMVIHSKDEKIIREFAMKKAVSRLLVNTPGALGGVGATTNLAPALTLGCGAVGKSATSDNITPLNLINIRRVAAGCRSLDDIRREGEALLHRTPNAASEPVGSRRMFAESVAEGGQRASKTGTPKAKAAGSLPSSVASAYVRAAAREQLSAADLEAITDLVMARLSALP